MSRRRVSPGLKKGQNLMQKAAAAYRAGKYASMQDALRGVARGGSRRRNPDDDVLFPYADRFSSETYPDLVTPNYSLMHVAASSTARAPSKVDGNLVFDAFFDDGSDIFGDFLTNPHGRGGSMKYARAALKRGDMFVPSYGDGVVLVKPAPLENLLMGWAMSHDKAVKLAHQWANEFDPPQRVVDMSRRSNPRKRGGRLVKGIVVAEMSDGYHVAVGLRSIRDAAYVEDDLQQAFPEGNWMREDNEVLTAFGLSVGKAKALAKQVAEMLGFPVGEVRVLSARAKMR